jgi:hypothetical protein
VTSLRWPRTDRTQAQEHAVPQVRRLRRADHPDHLELHPLGQQLEQLVPATGQHRHQVDLQLVEHTRRQSGLSRRRPMDEYVAITGRCFCLCHRNGDPVVHVGHQRVPLGGGDRREEKSRVFGGGLSRCCEKSLTRTLWRSEVCVKGLGAQLDRTCCSSVPRGGKALHGTPP